MSNTKHEFRCSHQSHPTVAKRADGQSVISGYAAVFYRSGDSGTEYQLFDDLVEHVMPGAFDRAIREQQDVRGLFNHETNLILGRTPHTMRLSVDGIGLRYEIDVPDTQLGRDLLVSLERGDITGSSFAFSAKKVAYQRGEARDVRELHDVDLFDVGPVTFPAYKATTSAAGRSSLEAIEREVAAWRAQHARDNKEGVFSDADAVSVRASLVRLDG